MGLSTRPCDPSFSELYLECIQSFGRFLLALSEEDCRVIHLEQVNLSEILEEYGRTKIWGDQAKADLPARARGSLDDTLRHNDELKSTDIARRKYDPDVGSDHDSISSVSADSDSDSNDDGGHRAYRMPKICLIVQQMLEQIRSLYELSALLRRPKIADKYIRSVNSKSNRATLNDQDSLPLYFSFSHCDEGHIVEKVLQWRGLTKSGRCVEFDNEDVAPVGQTLTDDGVEDIVWFCQRLAGANTRRREQLQYWTDHPYDPKQDKSNVVRPETQFQVPVQGKQVEEKEPLSQPATLNPPNLAVSRKGPKSVMSKQSFSTVAVSDVHDTKTNVRPRTVYAPTAIGQGRANSVPDPPKTERGNFTFPCPYCGMTLETSEMQNRATWKRHVFRDLRPYVCTFEDCTNTGKLYVSRHDWIYHELQVHRRKYVCKECDKRCAGRKELSTHLREHYKESIPPAQLSLILDLCDHQVDVSCTSEKDTCLVCGEELQLSALQGHLAAHMEDIALFVLPNADEEEETGGSRASLKVAKLESKGTNSGTDSEASSLAFSTAGDYGQTPADFSMLLTGEEAGYTSKFSSWRTTDEDQELESIKAVVARIEDPDREVRYTAVQALCGQSTLTGEILEAIAARLEDSDPDVRRAAVQTISRQLTLPEEIRKAMAARLKDPDREVRKTAVQAFGPQSTLSEGLPKDVVSLLGEQEDNVLGEEETVDVLGEQEDNDVIF
ncbi:hypothetical protein PENNAL_c0013G04005 [Penicillium nalgiovense]|uniref:C2H2-type domain-containing protein n=1 Tax=Penicillium nalgiovense TaxID=60175 RepID=A0A1V6YQN4_PENNA|nr:hypothetical protein PENNAL_c0013G04005 [Penicillium nalgiovense]